MTLGKLDRRETNFVTKFGPSIQESELYWHSTITKGVINTKWFKQIDEQQ